MESFPKNYHGREKEMKGDELISYLFVSVPLFYTSKIIL